MTMHVLTKEALELQPHELGAAHICNGLREIGSHLEKGSGEFSAEHELTVLKKALQAAVTLEFATLPPYLTAIWSIKDELHPVAKSIREILQEEMLHMALACNMLTSIGGTPEINTAVPQYPGKLPLGVHKKLTVSLSGLCDETLKVFMEIERPNHPGHFEALKMQEELEKVDEEAGMDKGDFTIGEFYADILAAFKRQNPKFSVDRQITGPLSWFIIKDLEDVEKAIRTIQDQGEGSEESPDMGGEGLSHYFRFAEVLERKKLVLDEETGLWDFKTPIDFDLEEDVRPVGTVPEGGYNSDNVSNPEVLELIRLFNVSYSKLLDQLDSVWKNDDGQARLWQAIETMFSLQRYALPLMQIQRPDGKHYGPDFRYIPENER